MKKNQGFLLFSFSAKNWVKTRNVQWYQRRALNFAIFSIFALCVSLCTSSQTGSHYIPFGFNGQVVNDLGSNNAGANAVAVQSDGKVVVAAYYKNHETRSSFDFVLVRFNTNGSLDSTFGVDGKVFTEFADYFDDVPCAMTIQNSKILVAGYTVNQSRSSGYKLAMSRYNADGSLDLSFGQGTGKVLNDKIVPGGLGVQFDGKIVVVGTSKGLDGHPDFGIARFNTDGNVDLSFGINGFVITDFQQSPGEISYDAATCITFLDGNMYVAGGQNGNFAIASYHLNGSLNNSFGNGGKVVTDFAFRQPTNYNNYNNAFAIAAYIDSGITKLVVGGVSNVDQNLSDGKVLTNVREFAIAQYTLDGVLDERFGIHGKVVSYFGLFQEAEDVITGLSIYQDDAGIHIIAGGKIGGSGDIFMLARYDHRGSFEGSTASLLGQASALALQTGTINVAYLAGTANHLGIVNNDNKIGIAAIRLNNFVSPCASPTGLVPANLTEHSVTLRWDPRINATNYSLQWRIAPGFASDTAWKMVQNIPSAIYTLQNLRIGNKYEAKVLTICANGSGSNYNSAINFATPCNSIPTGLRIGPISNNSAGFLWNPVPGVKNYLLQWKSLSSATWNEKSVPGSDSTCTLSNLLNGSSYTSRIQARCNVGYTGFSNEVSFSTLCAAPQWLPGQSSYTLTTAKLVWSTNASNNVSAGGYKIRWRSIGSQLWSGTSNLSNPTYTINNLLPGTTYTFQLANTCTVGASSFGEEYQFSTPCNKPTGLGATNVAGSSAFVSWTSAPGAISYNLQYKPAALGSANWNNVTGITTTSYNLNDLTGGTTYNMRIQNVCSSGLSDFSPIENFTTTCTKPSNLSTRNITSSWATITWSNVPGALSYKLQWKKSIALLWNTKSSIAAPIYDLVNLSSNTSYDVRVSIACTNGESGYSNILSFSTNACTAPSDLAIQKLAYNSTQLIWTSVPGAKEYTLQWKEANAPSWTTATQLAQLPFVYDTVQQHFELNNLTEGTAYSARVASVCYNASSSYSVPINFTTFSNTTKSVSPKVGSNVTLNEHANRDVELRVVPTPFHRGNAIINYKLAKAGNIFIRLIDLNGRMLQTFDAGYKQSGEHLYNALMAEKLVTGFYLITLEQDNKIIARAQFVVSR